MYVIVLYTDVDFGLSATSTAKDHEDADTHSDYMHDFEDTCIYLHTIVSIDHEQIFSRRVRNFVHFWVDFSNRSKSESFGPGFKAENERIAPLRRLLVVCDWAKAVYCF